MQYLDVDSEGRDTSVCSLFSDYNNGALELVEVTSEDFLDASISCLYSDENTGLEKWWDAEVADIDYDSDKSNPDFYVYYKETEESLEDIDYFLEPLLEQYLNGCVRFLDCPERKK